MKRFLINNPSLHTNGGGEKEMGYFCQFLENTYKDISIDILVYNYFGTDIFGKNMTNIEKLNERFGVSLRNTHIVNFKGDYGDSEIANTILAVKLIMLSSKYDVFINWAFQSKQFAKAKINLYRCMFPPKPANVGTHIRSKFYWKLANRSFSTMYDAYLPNSEYSKYWLNTYWPEIPEEKQLLLYPPVLHEKSTVVVEQASHDDKKNIILSVGRFFVEGHNKKQLEMVKCFIDHEKQFQDYSYHLAGALTNREEDRHYVEQIKQLARKHPNIVLHINCSEDELTALYRSAKIFWHATGFGESQQKNPEKVEHFGITTVEAMHYGVIPIVINAGGQREIVSLGVNGFLWNTFDECVDYTRKVIADDNLRIEMALAARIRSNDYSIESFYKNCEKICNKLGI